ncbi:MAG TPA: cadherin domain-containing protein [Tepidisphaeraceae bacterium]|nr:cadherin domain-containing protein [Tepidisphaeraceae bacterium]
MSGRSRAVTNSGRFPAPVLRAARLRKLTQLTRATHPVTRPILQPFIESLERRSLLAAFTLEGTTLTVITDDAPQIIRVRRDGGTIRALASGRTRVFDSVLVRDIRIQTGAGNDQIRIAVGLPAVISTGAGNDSVLAVTRGAKRVDAGDGDDTIRTGSGDDSIDGGAGDDLVFAADGNDTLHGGDGRDELRGEAGDDYIAGNAQPDRLLGGEGNDTIVGHGGSDVIDTGPGNDSALGGTGNDKLFATEGNDTLRGGAGDDILYSGPGADRLAGQSGNDQLSYFYASGGLNVVDGAPTGPWADADIFDGIEAIETSPAPATLSGTTGNDTLSGNSGDDEFVAGPGDDFLHGGDGFDTATFTGRWRDYAISAIDADTFLFSDERVGSPDGNDTVRQVESFTFDDGNLLADQLLNVPPALALDSGGSVPELAANGTAVAIFAATDNNALDELTFTLLDNAGGRFAINSITGELSVANTTLIDFETAAEHAITVAVTDARAATTELAATIQVQDVNEPPAVMLTQLVSSLDEDQDTSAPIAIADIVITDDALGSPTLSLTGDDAILFEIDGSQLMLRPGAALDFESNPSLAVAVRVNDPSITNNPDDAPITLSINDVNEMPTGATLSPDSVNENAANGTLVGTVSGQDPDGGDSLTYLLADDAGGRFAVNSAGLLTVADGALLDFESAETHAIVVSVTDAGGLSADFTLTVNLNDLPGVVYNGTSGADTFTGGLEPDTILGNGGNDSLAGAQGTDSIDGGAGNDTVSGDSGNDTLIGGTGTDWVFFVSSPAGVVVNLATGTATGDGNDSLATFENVRGSGFGDTLIGSTAANYLDGMDGDDSLDGGSGNDSLRGGAGSDTLNGGAGTDIAYYDNDTAGVSVSLATGTAIQASGTDTLIAIESVVLSSFNDTLVGSTAANTITDGAGDDSIDGGAGNDIIFLSAGNDTAIGGAGTDRVDFLNSVGNITASLATGVATSSNPADGTDTFSSFESLRGSSVGNDSLTGNAAANTLLGGGGNDTLAGGGGNDSLSGDAGTSDTAVFTGNWAQYTITLSGANYTLVDTRAGSPDGTDTVHNTTEFFQFANGTIPASQLLNVAPTITGISNNSVQEQSANGTPVGTVTSSDGNSLDTRSFSLIDNAGGRFQINTTSGLVSVLDGSMLLIANQPTHEITVRVTDAKGLTGDMVILITLTA